jgi:ABC-type bacteriocin/lantibiotic exporter with double-glycine peptidase domain
MSKQDRRRLLSIFSISLFNDFLGVVGVASILPFVAIISEPELVDTNQYILMFKEYSGIHSYHDLVVIFGIGSFLLIVLGSLITVLDSWLVTRFSYDKEGELSNKLLQVYLGSDSIKFSRKKNSEKVKMILAEVDRVILDTFFSFFDMISNILAAILIIVLLIVVNLKATLIIAGSILLAYTLIHLFVSKRLEKWGEEFADLETDIYSEVLQTLNLYQEIKVSGTSRYFSRQYLNSFKKMSNNQFKVELISLIPQQLIEVITFASILFIAIYFAINPEQEDISSIAMISVYAFAAYRLMPAINSVFDNIESIIFSSAILKPLVRDLSSDLNQKQREQQEQAHSISLNNQI